jgi:hypothetical protein
MTWKEFKQEMEKGGVTDDMDIQYIDINSGGMELSIDLESGSEGKSFNVYN